MPAISRKDGADSIVTGHGCDATTVTDQGSDNVFVNSIGVVRQGDLHAVHTFPVGPACVPHALPLTSFSSTVFVNSKGVGRQGDEYVGHVLLSGSTNVFAGG